MLQFLPLTKLSIHFYENYYKDKRKRESVLKQLNMAMQ